MSKNNPSGALTHELVVSYILARLLLTTSGLGCRAVDLHHRLDLSSLVRFRPAIALLLVCRPCRLCCLRALANAA